jgi:hypothetical protein
MTSVLQSHPEADIPTIVVSPMILFGSYLVRLRLPQDLLSSYRDLYSESCVVCDQCWSVEGSLFGPVYAMQLQVLTVYFL